MDESPVELIIRWDLFMWAPCTQPVRLLLLLLHGQQLQLELSGRVFALLGTLILNCAGSSTRLEGADRMLASSLWCQQQQRLKNNLSNQCGRQVDSG